MDSTQSRILKDDLESITEMDLADIKKYFRLLLWKMESVGTFCVGGESIELTSAGFPGYVLKII